MAGGGGDQEVVNRSEPFAQQLPFVQKAFGLADKRLQSQTNNPDAGKPTGDPNDPFGFRKQANDAGLPFLPFFQGDTVAGLGEDTLRAQGLGRTAARGIRDRNSNASSSLDDLINSDGFTGTSDFSSAALDTLAEGQGPAAGNPFVDSIIDASTRGMQSQFAQQRNLRSSQATNQGAFGGTRAALAQGQADAAFNQSVGDLEANVRFNDFNRSELADAQSRRDQAGFIGMQGDIENRNFQNNLTASDTNFRNNLSALDRVAGQNAQDTLPAEILSMIGKQNDDQTQRLIDAEMLRFNFERDSTDLALNPFNNTINQFSGPTTSTQSASGGGGGFGNVLGGALVGAGAKSIFNN